MADPTPTDATEARLFGLVAQLTRDAAEQSRRVADGISSLRWQLWVIFALIVILSAARDGVMTRLKAPGLELETSSVSAVQGPPERGTAESPTAASDVGLAAVAR